MAFGIKIREILVNEGKRGAGPFSSVRAKTNCGKELA
jgi:hypothetical protein